ncbi:Uncharacterised protein [Halioglobus japonicus]|nr:Uncharacterised protein [Halioglobus japonicus]
MKHRLTALFLALLATSAAAADVNRGDLYASCIKYQNAKWKEGFGGTLSYLTASQREELAPLHFEVIRQECNCTVTAAFSSLSASTIDAYNSALEKNGDGIVLGTDEAAQEFKEAGMMDKNITCTEKSLESSEYSKKLAELSK